MNIFFFSKNTQECARMHCSKHTVKMIVEYAQLLCTAHRLLDGTESVVIKNNRRKKVWILPNRTKNEILYSATHINHPSAKWTRHTRANYTWLFNLWSRLCDEYEYRYGKIHATKTKLWDLLITPPVNIPDGIFSSPWRAMPEKYKMPKTSIDYCELSYQAYFNGEKQHIADWKNRETPHWFKAKNL